MGKHTREAGQNLAFALSEREDTGGSDPRYERQLPQRTAAILERIKFTHVKVPSASLAHSRHSKNQGIFFDGKDQASSIFTHAVMSRPAPYPHGGLNKYLRNVGMGTEGETGREGGKDGQIQSQTLSEFWCDCLTTTPTSFSMITDNPE